MSLGRRASGSGGHFASSRPVVGKVGGHSSGGTWHKLRNVKGGHSIQDQVRISRAAGVRVKRHRPKCLVTRLVNVWGAEEGTPDVQLVDQERHSFASALHFVQEQTGRRLITWAMDRWLADLEADQDLPI